jgi:hypothetical protein
VGETTHVRVILCRHFAEVGIETEFKGTELDEKGM